MLGEEGCGTESLQKRQRVQTSGRKSFLENDDTDESQFVILSTVSPLYTNKFCFKSAFVSKPNLLVKSNKVTQLTQSALQYCTVIGI